MTTDEVIRRLRALEVTAGTRDFERAHAEEDELHRDVLQAIAEGRNLSPADTLARAALRSQRIKFGRYCA